MLSEFLNLITSIYCSSCYWIRNNEVRNCHLSSSNFKTKYRLKLLFTIASESLEFEPLSLASYLFRWIIARPVLQPTNLRMS